VGALAHYLEEDGIPTTQISLIAKHTEIIKPPRALWVPFELGRPLGVPDQPVFQRKVALAALKLLAAKQGPVLELFSEEAPGSGENINEESTGWACPISFSPASADKTEHEELAEALQREVAELRPWYDLGVEKQGRTALVAFIPERAADFFAGYLVDGASDSSPDDLSPGLALRLATHDLKAFYFMAAASRPGAGVPAAKAFNNWFWNETAAGRTLMTLKEICLQSPDKEVRLTAGLFLVPMPQ
jgi:hypothetical protein